MTVLDNTIKAEDTCASLDKEFVKTFSGDYDQLAEALGLYDVETVTAATALYQYTITGELNSTTPAEGDETPLSKYTVAKTSIGDVSPKRYSKLTTAEAVLKGGVENAVLRTDRKMMNQSRDLVLTQFYDFLKAGTGTAIASTTLQGALAMGDAALGDKMEDNHDQGGTLVHYVNRQDAASYLAEANITTQTAFGLTYLESFLGVDNVILTNRIAAGDVIVTPVENIHPYALDFSALGEMGLFYETDDYGIIGVHHVPNYNRGSVQTFVMLGLTLVPEITDYIVTAKFAAATASGD